jgi:aryl-alcohol dehydrogenase-like predicted oxidoreductase
MRYNFPDDFEAIEARHMLPHFNAENFSKNVDLVKIFEDLAAKKGATPSQVVLAWILAQGQELFPIPGTKNLKCLEQNLGALKVGITAEDDAQIRKIIRLMGGLLENDCQPAFQVPSPIRHSCRHL